MLTNCTNKFRYQRIDAKKLMTSCIKQVDWFLAGEIGEYIGNNFVNNDGNTFRNGVQELGQRSRDQLKHCAISVHWPRKFTDSEISEYEYFFNIHPGFLPIGRGMYPLFLGNLS